MSEASPIRVLTIDDHPLLREGVAAVIDGEPDMKVVGEASTGREGIESYHRHRPDVTLVDLRLPDMSGVEVMRCIRKDHLSARFVVLTTYSGDVQALDSIKAGASAYLLKSMLRTELLETVRLVNAGRRRIPAEIATDIAEHAADDSLTGRELDVLRAVGAGCSNKQIATQLGITEGTVKAHMKNILPKLNARHRTHAVMIAVKRGMLDV